MFSKRALKNWKITCKNCQQEIRLDSIANTYCQNIDPSSGKICLYDFSDELPKNTLKKVYLYQNAVYFLGVLSTFSFLMWLENKDNYSLKASFFTENNFEFKPGELLSWSPLWLIIFIIFLVGFIYVRGIKLEELFHQHSPKGTKKTIVEKREIKED